jgi:hypothetical protein
MQSVGTYLKNSDCGSSPACEHCYKREDDSFHQDEALVVTDVTILPITEDSSGILCSKMLWKHPVTI